MWTADQYGVISLCCQRGVTDEVSGILASKPGTAVTGGAEKSRIFGRWPGTHAGHVRGVKAVQLISVTGPRDVYALLRRTLHVLHNRALAARKACPAAQQICETFLASRHECFGLVWCQAVCLDCAGVLPALLCPS